MSTKIVLFEVEVPDNDYCSAPSGEHCYYYDNEGGHSTCALEPIAGAIPRENHIDDGVLKPEKCRFAQVTRQ